MSNLSDIKRRLNTVKQTKQITGAMQTVSVAKMRKAAELCEHNTAYLSAISDIMHSAALACDECLSVPTTGIDVVLVMSSERGLCGGFDNGIFAAANDMVTDNTVIVPIGTTAVNHYRSKNNVDMSFGECCGVQFEFIKRISDNLLSRYGKDVKSVAVVYARLNKQTVYTSVEKLLPIEWEEGGNSAQKTVLEPSPQQVLNALLPLYLSGKIYGAALRNYAAEQSARHQAMSTATESADSLIQELSSEYHRQRQAEVTGQIVEIAGATSALSRKGGGNEKRA